ncbi:hypothetical protein SAMN05660690_2618 [Geodermatophilus telluris]|uniref:Uncharacterized protein n=1 Tax=Geodermatophilus telluris TaxID=1190417 RepID=A0A1G6PLY2_9ACTN|nr:hypothetical protein [Geodermatophilus telluris]SDC80365.1 hypothetical protein SAMN05660690_2618 [Geodermatophilus telluris]
MWTSALFVGQFVCPLVVLAPTGALGGLGAALALLGAVVVVAVGVGLTRPVAVAAAH